jgi:hypothetical protein
MAQTAEQLALANNAAKDLGFGNVTGAKDYLSSLPVESLSGSNPTFPDNNTTSNLSYEGVVSSAQNLLTETTNAANALNEQMKSGGAADKRVQDLMAAATGRGQETLDMEKQAGLDTQQKYLNDLNASILNKTTALEKAKLADQYAIMGLEGWCSTQYRARATGACTARYCLPPAS